MNADHRPRKSDYILVPSPEYVALLDQAAEEEES